ncbi:alpha/beta hydrolase [Novosphingobium mangrovi (ex Hu et al. 2023)]|uniref:Alpha/beta hydrolase n=1 Tax=Novosphingobium mangrovi (ex Hu et al. 2023) TaxID=2930094 RepID=A0ABT0A7X3_9SPHN|nr:alpha/beta hydrolase [Novosphingobium mangrovi (ex Hu et al. 2023)]MCJ1959301.1 alpha/beta hydrolase [Novosphingobium mangrovi (ex Hu et al. 2023)]
MALADNYIFDLSDNVVRTPVSYLTRYGITISADLYTAVDFDETTPAPALVIGAPYGGVKEQGPGVYANELAQRGFVVLTFDPSYNGYSGGETRHLSSPDVFVEDFHAAVDFLGTREFVDREKIGALGICGSGGFALSAASVDPRIKAIATASMYDISRMHAEGFGGSLSEEDRKAQLAQIAEHRYAEFEGEPATLTPRGALLELDPENNPVGTEFGEFYSRPRGYHPNSIAQFTMTSGPSFMNFPLLDKIDWIAPRKALLVIGEEAHSAYFSEDVANDDNIKLHVVPGANHVDLYDKTDVIPFDAIESFFNDNLK